MRIVLLMMLFVSSFAMAGANKVTTLHHPTIDDYERHKQEYDRLGLEKGASRTEACITSNEVSSEVFQSMPLFDQSGSFKYKNAVLHNIGIEKNGVCFTFAGLNNNHFKSWLHSFISNKTSIAAGSYVVEFK
jgi:hypothetical protein